MGTIKIISGTPTLRLCFHTLHRDIFIYVKCDDRKIGVNLNAEELDVLHNFFISKDSILTTDTLILTKETTGITINKAPFHVKTSDYFWKELEPYLPALKWLLKVKPFPLDILIDLWILSTKEQKLPILELSTSIEIYKDIYHLGFEVAKSRRCFVYRLGMATINYIIDRKPDINNLRIFAQSNPEIWSSLVDICHKYSL